MQYLDGLPQQGYEDLILMEQGMAEGEAAAIITQQISTTLYMVWLPEGVIIRDFAGPNAIFIKGADGIWRAYAFDFGFTEKDPDFTALFEAAEEIRIEDIPLATETNPTDTLLGIGKAMKLDGMTDEQIVAEFDKLAESYPTAVAEAKSIITLTPERISFNPGWARTVTIRYANGVEATLHRSTFNDWHCDGSWVYKSANGRCELFFGLRDKTYVLEYTIGGETLELSSPCTIFPNELGTDYLYIYRPQAVELYYKTTKLGKTTFDVLDQNKELRINTIEISDADVSQTPLQTAQEAASRSFLSAIGSIFTC